MTPRDALAEMAAGAIDLWPPTSTTLQQLAPARDLEDVRRHLAPVEAARPPGRRATGAGHRPAHVRGARAPSRARRSTPSSSGRRRLVVVDPGDPSDEAAEAVIAARRPRRRADRRDPADRAGPGPRRRRGDARDAPRGADPRLGRRDAVLSSEIVAIEDGDASGSPTSRSASTRRPGTHADHLAFEVPAEGVVLVGDLEGPGPSRVDPGAGRRGGAQPVTRTGRGARGTEAGGAPMSAAPARQDGGVSSVAVASALPPMSVLISSISLRASLTPCPNALPSSGRVLGPRQTSTSDQDDDEDDDQVHMRGW